MQHIMHFNTKAPSIKKLGLFRTHVKTKMNEYICAAYLEVGSKGVWKSHVAGKGTQD